MLSPEIYSFLAAAGAQFKVHDHSPIVSFSDAKSVLPFDPGSMVKGLAFTLPNQAYAIVGMCAADRADYKKIADTLGIRRTDLGATEPEEVVQTLHMMPGGVVPLPINGASVVFDLRVIELDTIYCGSGRTDTTLEIAAADLVRIAGSRFADLTKPQTPEE
jgi:Cys-tRNA(Pro)/Cys-tRNA(Cys) deacylase